MSGVIARGAFTQNRAIELVAGDVGPSLDMMRLGNMTAGWSLWLHRRGDL